MDALLQSRQRELQIIAETAESMSPDELRKAIFLSLRELDYHQLNLLLGEFLKQIEQDNTLGPLQKTCLQVYRDFMMSKYLDTVSHIQEAVDRLAEALPSNPYNIQEVLRELALQIDPHSGHACRSAFTHARVLLNPHENYERPIYNVADLEAEYSRGHEEGYQKAIDNLRKSKNSEIMDQLDID